MRPKFEHLTVIKEYVHFKRFRREYSREYVRKDSVRTLPQP
jgi:hypothetical protein